MCGFTRIIDFENKSLPPSLLLAINRVFALRGPDDEGYVLIDQSQSLLSR